MRQLCLMLSLTGLRVFGFVSDPWLSHERIHRLTGEPARVDYPVPANQALSVVTWNIERGEAYDAVLDVLRRLEPDVLLLQEVDQGCRRGGYRDVARDLATALDMNWVAAGSSRSLARDAVANRRSPARRSSAGSSFRMPRACRSRPRIAGAGPSIRFSRAAAVRLALKARTGGVIFYNTHIESGHNERLQQRQMAGDRHRPGAHDRRHARRHCRRLQQPSRSTSLTLKSLARASSSTRSATQQAAGRRRRGSVQPIDWIFGKHIDDRNRSRGRCRGRLGSFACHDRVWRLRSRSCAARLPCMPLRRSRKATRGLRVRPISPDHSCSAVRWGASTRSSTDPASGLGPGGSCLRPHGCVRRTRPWSRSVRGLLRQNDTALPAGVEPPAGSKVRTAPPVGGTVRGSMPPENRRYAEDRAQTDESLRLEREKADHALKEQLAAIDETADAVISRARTRADEVLAETREHTDRQAAVAGATAQSADADRERTGGCGRNAAGRARRAPTKRSGSNGPSRRGCIR